MLFHSYIFVMLFLPIALLGYYLLNRFKQYHIRNVFLLIMSLWFISYLDVRYLLAVLVSMIGNFGIYLLLKRQEAKNKRKTTLALGLSFNLVLLLVFKYSDFVLENINTIFHSDFPLWNLLLPLGISFYTFKQITFLMDCYRDETIRVSFLEYALYITFFPQFIQGPITLQGEMVPQFRMKQKAFQCESFARGIYAFTMGLGKKVLIADTLSKVVAAGYDDVTLLNSPSAILLILSYTLQIYFDFSGYCDMALGLGTLFQIHIPINFNSPYKAVSIDDFWDRWHMTLTRFFTRYVYFPLGGSRKGRARTYLNILIIFFLSGLWHGAAYTFIIWGLLHGLAKMICRVFKQVKITIPKIVGWCITFIFVNVAWVFFRAESLKQAGFLLKQAVSGGFGPIEKEMYEAIDKMVEVSLIERMDVIGLGRMIPGYYLIAFIVILVFACVFMRNTQEKMQNLKFNLREMITTTIILFISLISLSGITEYIYFNF